MKTEKETKTVVYKPKAGAIKLVDKEFAYTPKKKNAKKSSRGGK